MSKDDSTDDYEVGYGKPPKNSQFQKGVSGNPTGRPKKARDLGMPRQNYDPPRNQSDRRVADFAYLSVSNWLHAALAEAPVRIGYPILLFPPRSALGELGPSATTCRSEGATPAASLLHV